MKVANPFRVAYVATLADGVGILLTQGVQSLSTILLYVGTALFLALGLDPVVSWLERRRLPRWAAVLTTIVGLLALFAGVILMIVPIIVGQITQLVVGIQDFANSRTFGQFVTDVKEWVVTAFPVMHPDFVDEQSDNLIKWIQELDWATIGGGVLSTGFAIVAGFGGAFIVLILTIYFTSALPNLKSSVYQLVPASKRARFVDLSEQITDSVGHYVIGQLTLGAINGVLSAILLTIIDAPFPAVLAVIAFLFSILPLVGTLTGSTIIVLVCLIPGLGTPESTWIIAAVYYLVYMQIEAYFISPRIMNRAVSVPGAVVVIAALAGGALGAVLGALVAIPIAASILIIYRQVIIPRQNER